MTLKHLCILLLALVAIGTAAGQSDDIPIEHDNQFPPEDHLDTDGAFIEGSGDGTIDEPLTANESTPTPQLEEVQSEVLDEELTPSTDADSSCPKPCICHVEGGTGNFVVDCSGYDLTDFPSPLDPKTTILNVQNNKLSEIPKTISVLKNLKELNAENNSIMDVAAGSISELPELVSLKLSNNRLIEYPQDLKNSFSLTKLKELDLGGNDMRTDLKAETFTIFKSLRQLTLPTTTPELFEDLCGSLRESLETLCTGSCNTQYYECQDAPQNIDDDLLDAALPGMIPFEEEENIEHAVNTDNVQADINDTTTEETPVELATNYENSEKSETTVTPPKTTKNAEAANEPFLRSNFKKQAIVEGSKDVADKTTTETKKTEADVKIGAATDAKTGGVDKSIIGLVVAGMVIIVAAITIKKNWSSIRKRFSSTPRGNERPGANANGTTPEEVPLQDKDKLPV